MALGTSDVVKTVDLMREAISGKSISLESQRISTSVHKCDSTKCKWQKYQMAWRIARHYNSPFYRLPIFKEWNAAEVWIVCYFEYDGCDINAAHFILSGTSYNRWYNDGATFNIKATGDASKLPGESGCNACGSPSVRVIFELTLTETYDFVCSDVTTWQIEIFGNGKITITEI